MPNETAASILGSKRRISRETKMEVMMAVTPLGADTKPAQVAVYPSVALQPQRHQHDVAEEHGIPQAHARSCPG